MKTNKKDLPEEGTQLLSSDQNQAESSSNPRPFLRDAAFAAAGVAVGVAGSSFVHAQSTDEAGNDTPENVTSETTHDAAHQNSESMNNSATPSVNTAATDNVNENAKPEASPAPEEVVLTIAHGAHVAHVAHVENSPTFAEAFADARTQVGSGGVFSYNGQMYNTYYKEEWNNLSSEQKNEYYASISDHSDQNDRYMQPAPIPEPIHETSYTHVDSGTHSSGDEVYVLGVGSATIEGHDVYVAQLSAGGEDFVLLDIDKDGTFDYAIVDINSDGAISQDEVHDISQHHITVDQMQAAIQPEPDVFVDDPNMPNYMPDADISHFA